MRVTYTRTTPPPNDCSYDLFPSVLVSKIWDPGFTAIGCKIKRGPESLSPFLAELWGIEATPDEQSCLPYVRNAIFETTLIGWDLPLDPNGWSVKELAFVSHKKNVYKKLRGITVWEADSPWEASAPIPELMAKEIVSLVTLDTVLAGRSVASLPSARSISEIAVRRLNQQVDTKIQQFAVPTAPVNISISHYHQKCTYTNLKALDSSSDFWM
jgi:hypothetical protein